jgi:catechol 2,3-dioxygenase-like lactoylglutathione lyase family enzyme
MIKFAHTIVYVKDIEVSKKFYSDLLEIKLLQDHGACVFYDNGLSLHQALELNRTVFKTTDYDLESVKSQGHHNTLIYFESDNPDDWCNQLKEKGVRIIHDVETQFWGQRVFRFYDPDNNIVEIGEINY